MRRTECQPQLAENAPSLSVRALTALLDGRPRAAIADADAAVVEFAVVDVAAMRPMTLGMKAIVRAQIGRPGAARLALADIEDSWQHEAKAQMPREQAESWLLVGAGVRRDGRAADADRANGLAVARTGLIDDFLTPGPGTVVVLTEREREVGELASKRRRNQEIADHLGISIRTVDNHLASLYRKLGIDRRDELSTWFENAGNGQAFTVASDSADSH